jgi:hypothetical protein
VRHERISAQLSDYLDGSLSARDASRVETHLLDCESCRRALAELKQTVELLHGLRSGVDAPDISARVMSRIRAGEGSPSRFDRLRSSLLRLASGPLGAPLATAAIGLALVALLPPIDVEVSIPNLAKPAALPATLHAAAAPRAAEPRPRAPASPLLALRRSEAMSRDPFACLDSPAGRACRDQHASMTRLALENARAFLERVEAIPEAHRDPWLSELSQFAAESGTASDVAARLRATGDPLALRVATRFEEAR